MPGASTHHTQVKDSVPLGCPYFRCESPVLGFHLYFRLPGYKLRFLQPLQVQSFTKMAHRTQQSALLIDFLQRLLKNPNEQPDGEKQGKVWKGPEHGGFSPWALWAAPPS